MNLKLLLVHYSRVWEFEILILRVNILSRVEFNGEAESEVKFTIQRVILFTRMYKQVQKSHWIQERLEF